MPKATMVTCLPTRCDARLADGHDPVVQLRHVEALAVEDFIFEEDHRIGIADRRLHQALGIRRRIGHHHLQAGDGAIPRGIVLAVLGADAGGGTIGAAEHDGAAHLAARHVERLGGGIDDVVDGLHGEVEGHELDDGLQAREGRTHREAGEAMLGDRRVDDALRAELVQHALADLVGALILADFLAHQEHVRVAPHLFRHGLADRLAHRHRHHLGAFGDFGVRQQSPRRALTRQVRRNGRSGSSASAGSGGAQRFGAGAASASPITAIGVLTFTFSVPAGTRIAVSGPSSTASTSMVALSVSISAMTSPDFTLSPTFLSHLASLPSSMVGDSAGMRIFGMDQGSIRVTTA